MTAGNEEKVVEGRYRPIPGIAKGGYDGRGPVTYVEPIPSQPVLYTSYEVFCSTCGHIGYIEVEGNRKRITANCAPCGRPARVRP